MDDNNSNTSEWNEQQLFARLFFKITDKCKYYQALSDALNWKSQLECKISMVLGIAVEDEDRQNLFKIRHHLCNIPNPTNNKVKGKYGSFGQGMERKIAILLNRLFYAEANVDLICNKYMPFLKLRDEVDIMGL